MEKSIKKMSSFIKEMSNDDMIIILNEVYEWKKTGMVRQGKLKELYNVHKEYFVTMYYLEEAILFEAHKRFENVVKVLMTSNPGLYIR